MNPVVSVHGYADLLDRWNRHWSPCPPIAHQLREIHRDRWVRFHSLPGSKRYPSDESEMSTVLDRHHAMLTELFADGEILVATCTWSQEREPPERTELDLLINPGGVLWVSVLTNEDPDPDFRVYTHLYVDAVGHAAGSLDPLLRAVATDRTAGVIITDSRMSYAYHPYDGGADVLLANTEARDELRVRHAAWLSAHPLGL